MPSYGLVMKFNFVNIVSLLQMNKFCFKSAFISPICLYMSSEVSLGTQLTQLSIQYCIVQFSRSVVSNSLRPHGLQHARPPCPSPTPGVYSNSCLLSQWCYLTISSFVVPFSSCLRSFPTSGFFQMNQLFAWGGQSIGVSASTTVLPMNAQDWSPLRWTGWIL